MAEITFAQISASYQLGCQVYDNALPRAEAIRRLERDYGLGSTSASDYIGAYRHMRGGDVYRRSISEPAVRHFLWSILTDYGGSAAGLALASFEAHIEYYEGLGRGRRHGLRTISEEFRCLIASEDVEKAILASLMERVSDSWALSREDRARRLPPAGSKPARRVVRTTLYIRNADVIVERLMIANGRCEGCYAPAPFLKKSDQQPYLEVHHRIRLADGGDDTVENAIALCPNCHRQRHHG